MRLDFNKKYGKLFESHEQAKVETFYFENKNGKMVNVFLKREIPHELGSDALYDIFTPYGFGGPVVLEASDKEKLIKEYQEAFSDYCCKENIISEFIRFHPIGNDDVRKAFDGDVEHVGPQVIRDLSKALNENISKRILKQYRANSRKGMTVVYDQTGKYVDEFLEIYYATMNRNNAEDYYYFDRDFFYTLNEEMKGHYTYTYILLDGVVISGGLILFDDDYAYGFLGGTKESYYNFSPNLNLLIEEIKWLNEKKISYYLLGGGHKGEDGIYHFKKKFAKDSHYQYYVGKKIYNSQIYKALTKERFKDHSDLSNSSFFPAYRTKSPQLNKLPS